MINFMRIVILTLGLAVFSAQGAPPPNIVLIISDDQMWTDYSFMEHPHIKTPNLDRLASESLTFTRGYVPSSLCCPSLASIITGLYPHQHKVTSNDPPMPAGTNRRSPKGAQTFKEGREIMNKHLEALPTLPKMLKRKGYLSFQTGKWWQGHFSRGGFTHGMTKGQRHGDAGLKIGRDGLKPIYDFIATAQTEKKPFFVWYAPFLPHTPHTPPERLLNKYRNKTNSLHVARYWAMCEWLDETCGDLLKHLDEKGLRDDTIVVYVTDNGWIQNPNKGGYAPKSKQSPYDGGLRTPIMVRWPAQITPRMSDDLALSIDIAPTLLKAAGLKSSDQMQGIDLLDRKTVRSRKAVHGECFTHNAVDLYRPVTSLRWRWIIEGDWKLIVPAKQNQAESVVELYNLKHDPHETTNVAEKKRRREKRLRNKLDKWWPAKG
jgi:uncharacterized sulfatase